MPPPATTDRLTSYRLSQIRARSFSGFKHNALLFDELNRIANFHIGSEQFYTKPSKWSSFLLWRLLWIALILGFDQYSQIQTTS